VQLSLSLTPVSPVPLCDRHADRSLVVSRRHLALQLSAVASMAQPVSPVQSYARRVDRRPLMTASSSVVASAQQVLLLWAPPVP
jgi:hypothetical protein